MRRAVWMFVALALATLVAPVEAQTTLVAEVLPAPVGYVFAFSPPYPNIIYGYRTPLGAYVSYKARIGETGRLIVRTTNPNTVDTIVHEAGSSPLRVIGTVPLKVAYGLNVENGKNMIIFGIGLVYLSRYNIIYGIPRTPPPPMSVVVDEHMVDMNINATKVLAITNDAPVVVYHRRGPSATTRLSDLISAPEACIAWFVDVPSGFPWVGGIIISPACTKNIEIIRTVEYAGRLFAVVFRIPSVPRFGGRIEYVVMGAPTARVLSETGLVFRARANYPGAHIILGYDLTDMNVYLAISEDSKLMKGETLTVRDMTQVIKASGEIPKRVCSMPSKAQVLYKLLWSNMEVDGTFELLPGEVVLYEYGGAYYVCAGDMRWLEHGDLPIIKGPVYQEFLHPIMIYSPSGLPLLVVTSNGRVFYGPSIEIPFELYADNVIMWYSGSYRDVVELSITSVFTSAFFAVAVIIMVTVGGIIFFGRGKEAPEKIAVVWDVKPPPSLSLADNDTIEQTIKKHVEAFGVCPDTADLALYYEVLPPIPPNARADDTIVMCPFKTNPKTEVILRDIVSVLQTAFWGVRRLWKSRGYFYTVFGDEMLYMYFYKQEDEEKPEYVVANALESVVRSASFETTHFRRPLGLVIIVEPEMLPMVRHELSTLSELSMVPSGDAEDEGRPRTYNVRGYLSSRNVSTSIGLERIQEVVDREVPRILAVSSTNISELIEYLSEKAAAKGDEYMRKGLGEEL